MYTGNIIIVEMDMNPSSATYRQTRTRVEADALCQQYQCQMVKVSEYTDGDDTIEVYEDQSATSPTKGQRIEVVNQSTTAIYLTMYSNCEQIGYGDGVLGNSGYNIATQINANPYSSTYQQVRDDYRYKNTDICPLPNAEPIVNEYSHCKLVDYPASGVKGTNGKMIVEKYDANPYSLTYYDVISTEEVDAVECQAPDTADKQRVLCEYCELDEQGKNNGYKITKYIHINLFSPEYNDHVNIIRGLSGECVATKNNIVSGFATPNSNVNIKINEETQRVIYSTKADDDGYFEVKIPYSQQILSLYRIIDGDNVTHIDITDLDLSRVTSVSYMFQSNFNLVSINMDYCDLSNCTNFEYAFHVCYVENLDLSKVRVSAIERTSRMFYYSHCKTINLSGWNTPNITVTRSMFDHCESLEELDLSGWDLSNVSASDMVNMFAFCNQLTTIYARGCNATTLMKLSAVKPQRANIVTT